MSKDQEGVEEDSNKCNSKDYICKLENKVVQQKVENVKWI